MCLNYYKHTSQRINFNAMVDTYMLTSNLLTPKFPYIGSLHYTSKILKSYFIIFMYEIWLKNPNGLQSMTYINHSQQDKNILVPVKYYRKSI